ncbi:MAG: DUF1043 family protein [Proteobacteria bacterium]|nr:DUF1043 family protein [Pseudomonadota bacterium]
MTSDPAILIALGVFLAGLSAGCLFWRRYGAAEKRASQLEDDLREVSGKLEETRAELAAQREATSQHFERTAELFGDLTRQHVTVYNHLAEGARELCPDAPPALEQGFEFGRLERGADLEFNGHARPSEVQAALDAVRDAAREGGVDEIDEFEAGALSRAGEALDAARSGRLATPDAIHDEAPDSLEAIREEQPEAFEAGRTPDPRALGVVWNDDRESLNEILGGDPEGPAGPSPAYRTSAGT